MEKARKSALDDFETGFHKLNERFEDYYTRATGFLTDVGTWKKEIGELVNRFADDPKSIQISFELFDAERNNRFLAVGESLKQRITEAAGALEPFVCDTLKDIRLERRPLMGFNDFVSLNFPKFEAESLIFNTNITASCLQSFCMTGESGNYDGSLGGPRRSRGGMPAPSPLALDQPSPLRLQNLGNTPQNFSKGVGMPDQFGNFVSTPKSVSGRIGPLLLPASLSTNNLHSNGPKVFNFNGYVAESPAPGFAMTPHSKGFEKKAQGQALTCNTPSGQFEGGYMNLNVLNVNNREAEYLSQHSEKTFSRKQLVGYESRSRDQASVYSATPGARPTETNNRDDNLLMEMSLQDIPELSGPSGGKQTKTLHFDSNNLEGTRLTTQFPKSTNGTPRDYYSNAFNKTVGQPINFASNAQKSAQLRKQTEKFDQLDKSGRSSVLSQTTTPQTSNAKNRRVQATPNQKTPHTTGNPKDSFSARSKDLKSVSGNYNGDVSRDRSADRKALDVEKTRALKQLVSGRLAETLKDLKANRLVGVDLSNSGSLTRPSRHPRQRDFRVPRGSDEPQDNQTFAQPDHRRGRTSPLPNAFAHERANPRPQFQRADRRLLEPPVYPDTK